MREPDWQSEDGDIKLYCGDCAAVLADLPEKSVNCCVTSPPYWGLRDYGTAEWEGGEAECDHTRPDRQGASGERATRTTGHDDIYRDLCGKCGARRIDSQLGLEATPEEYVDKLVEIFRQVRRVLRDDGTVWLNLGDSYGGLAGGNNGVPPEWQRAGRGQSRVTKIRAAGTRTKDLCGIPWRVAFALQADGWYLRQDIIWAKPNPMPESVTDRCTKAHEYIFLLSKSARYWYDAEAIKEEAIGTGGGAFGKVLMADVAAKSGAQARRYERPDYREIGRNRRSVWTVATQPYSEAHFATYPAKLIEPCILAGCPAGGVVLDPFIGSGTTAEVCATKGRGCIGIELNREYMELAIRRIRPAIQQGPDDALFKQAKRIEQPLLIGE
uniref:site-specific DNA-methyltransferase (cytosine-N(4)-specific) n=1 Tax=viral metagenome TaxID=1070528 RepID=A0A6M3LCF7_9ZZZZ